MSGAKNFSGLEEQHVELLPARLVLSGVGIIGHGGESESMGVGDSGGAGGNAGGGGLTELLFGGSDSSTGGAGGAGGTGQGGAAPLALI